ncbi:MAG: hypothetical protein KJZ80_08890 [Hyphomicrobiaceae bacterium]|nr:hypothetical protein [Hyphomicrobiaceae bacterium]
MSSRPDIPIRHSLFATRPLVFITHPVFRKPGFGRHHPLSTGRQAAVLDLCEALGWLAPELVRTAPLADRALLERFHAAHYLDALEEACRTMTASPAVRERYRLGTMECPLFEGLWDRACASVGGAVLAARTALSGAVGFHPAGGTHHGRPDRASGFCYFNDPVFAILTLLDGGVERLLYVDLDAHHGDGVQDAFAGDRRVSFFSVHEDGRWPGTGGLDDRLAGRACNVPVPRGVTDAEYMLLIERLLVPRMRSFRPEAVVVTLGADALAGDPLSAMQLGNGTLWAATELCVAGAGAAVVLGGGGYNPWTTARLWAGMWALLSGQPIPPVLPERAQAVLGALTCDIVDDEDRDPSWCTTIADPQRHRESVTVRQQIHDIVARLLPDRA